MSQPPALKRPAGKPAARIARPGALPASQSQSTQDAWTSQPQHEAVTAPTIAASAKRPRQLGVEMGGSASEELPVPRSVGTRHEYDAAAVIEAEADDDGGTQQGGRNEVTSHAADASATALLDDDDDDDDANDNGEALVVRAEPAVAQLPRRSSAHVPIARPIAVTKHGMRQFVETAQGVRMFLQNCVCTVDLKCRPDLAVIATRARNAEYNPQRFAACIIRLREPKATALLFHTGKLVLTGAKNEDDARLGARKVAKIVSALGFAAAFVDFRVQNVVATGDCGFPIRLEGLADSHQKWSSYEPELFPGLIYRMQSPKVVCLIFVSGKVVLTGAKSRGTIVEAITKLYPMLFDFKKAPRVSADAGGSGGGAQLSVAGDAAGGGEEDEDDDDVLAAVASAHADDLEPLGEEGDAGVDDDYAFDEGVG